MCDTVSITLVTGGLVGIPVSFVTSENFQNTPLLSSEAVAWRLEVTKAVPAPFSGWMPVESPPGCRRAGARRRGDSHLQSPSA